MQINPIFAVPTAMARMPDCDALNSDLRNLFLRREKEGGHWRNDQPTMQITPGLFESRFDLFNWPDPCVQRLRAFCWETLGRTVAQLNQYTAEEMQRIDTYNHCWFHVTRRNGRFASHNHPMASWSGVYCVDSGTHDADQADSGALYFHNPHHLANMYEDPGNDRFVPFYGSMGWNLKLVPGDLVLFPSWLLHEVLPYHGDGERITVAFNAWFRRRP